MFPFPFTHSFKNPLQKACLVCSRSCFQHGAHQPLLRSLVGKGNVQPSHLFWYAYIERFIIMGYPNYCVGQNDIWAPAKYWLSCCCPAGTFIMVATNYCYSSRILKDNFEILKNLQIIITVLLSSDLVPQDILQLPTLEFAIFQGVSQYIGQRICEIREFKLQDTVNSQAW